ncbi:hypothetical protein CK203_031625 [Vitis vinifera]|uniref:Uncharacterized protein n=1 Tax=Vitis vinifera TaxID=29760 RepID=A0A438IFV9_VITVI|nr:hypothetical protein CK203_031625 [Vitis vinifera]
MDGEDWPDPLPKGWTLKKYSNGKVIQHFHYFNNTKSRVVRKEEE